MEPSEEHRRAAQALSRGDPLAALNLTAGDERGHARALRGIALAQLQELDAAARELTAAAAAFADAPLYRARALAALAEVAAARRELGTALDALAAAARELEAAGDARNAAWTRLVRARVLLLVGAADEARADIALAAERAAGGDAVLVAALELARAAAAARELSGDEALAALDRALAALARGEHPLLAAELAAQRDAAALPVGRVTVAGETSRVGWTDLARLFRGGAPLVWRGGEARRWLAVDAVARRALFCGEDAVDLSAREVLFALLAELARAWPEAVATDELVRRVFDGPPGDESHRDRARVELGRLRRALPAGAGVRALGNAWALELPAGVVPAVVELADEGSALAALVADGGAWAARDLALATGASVRTVQRALAELARRGDVLAVGNARARRWVAAEPGGIASQMFLVGLLAPLDPGSRHARAAARARPENPVEEERES